MIKSAAVLLLLTSAVYADNRPVLDQFAQGYRLRTEGGFSIYHLLLPREVYRNVTRPDLGDIRVLNAAGEVVPHALRRTERQRTAQTVMQPLPFFPLHVDPEDSNNLVKIMTDINGSITNIVVQGGNTQAATAAIRYYLIDLSAIKQDVDELQFDLAGPESSYIKTAVLEYSSDLSGWNKIETDTTLANMQYGQHQLVKDRIRLPGYHYKYLRLSWQGNSDGMEIKAVNAILNHVEYKQERQWLQVNGIFDKENKSDIYFDTGGFYPVDRVELEWPDENILIQAELSSRGDSESTWKRKFSGLLYKLKDAGAHLNSGPVDIQFTRDRYWRLNAGTGSGVGMHAPVLKYSWIPNELYFLARGDPPYVLAFGSAGLGPVAGPASLLNIINKKHSNSILGMAAIDEPVSLKGEEALTPELQVPWQRILLWGILVLGVIVIGVMAARLFKQINQSSGVGPR